MDIKNIIGKYNKVTFKYDRDIERIYINLEELYKQGEDTTHIVEGIYINTKSRFGDMPILVSGNYFVNLPKHLTDDCISMMNDNDLVEVVNAKKLGFTIYQYTGKNGTGYSVEWCDI